MEVGRESECMAMRRHQRIGFRLAADLKQVKMIITASPSRAKAKVAFSHFLHVILSIIGANSLSSDLMFFSQCIPG